jgi:hypothetical protein
LVHLSPALYARQQPGPDQHGTAQPILWYLDEPLDKTWERWLDRRFGRRAAPAPGRLLRSTHPVLNDILYFNNTRAAFWLQYGFP